MALDLRPLTLPELLDRAFGLYRRHFWLFIGIMAVPTTFAVALNVLVESLNYVTGARASVAPGAAPDPAVIIVMVGAIAAGLLLVLVAYTVVYMVALGATTLAVSEIYLGRMVTIREVYRRMRGRIWLLLRLLLLMGARVGGMVLAGLILTTGAASMIGVVTGLEWLAILLVFAGAAVTFGVVAFVTIRWGVAVPAVVLEDLGARASIRRSIELTRGRRWRVLLLVVCATVITYAVMALFQGPFLIGAALAGAGSSAGFILTLAGGVFGAIATTFTAPIMIIGLALLYYDARIRDEGLDLQLMMTAMDVSAAVTESSRG